jgi:hypothetical protein
MTDEPTDTPGVLNADPNDLIEGAISMRSSAEELRHGVRQAAREGGGLRVRTPDGRTLDGGEDVLHEAARLEDAAHLDVTLATALLLQDVCARLDDLRRATGEAAPVPHPGQATPESAPEVPCVIEIYHPNHLWWSRPTDGGVRGAPVTQVRYFCPGVRWQPPAGPVNLRPAVPPDGTS